VLFVAVVSGKICDCHDYVSEVRFVVGEVVGRDTGGREEKQGLHARNSTKDNRLNCTKPLDRNNNKLTTTVVFFPFVNKIN
jgi:hypothetical protein